MGIKYICLHLFTVFYLIQPSSKQIICFNFGKQYSILWTLNFTLRYKFKYLTCSIWQSVWCHRECFWWPWWSRRGCKRRPARGRPHWSREGLWSWTGLSSFAGKRGRLPNWLRKAKLCFGEKHKWFWIFWHYVNLVGF